MRARSTLGRGRDSETPAQPIRDRSEKRLILQSSEDDPQKASHLKELVRKYFGREWENRMFPKEEDKKEDKGE